MNTMKMYRLAHDGRSTMRTILGVSLALALLITLPAMASPPERLTPALTSADAYLVGADLRKRGASLVAWASTDDRLSAISLYRGERLTQRVELDDYLVKGLRWIEPGRTFWVAGILPREGEMHGTGEDRLYAVSPTGAIELTWQTGSLEGEVGAVTPAGDGDHWIASRFGDETARVTLGVLGDGAPLASWALHSADGRANRETSTRSAFLLGNLLSDGVGILWRGDVWLAEVGDPEPDLLSVPGDCREVQKVDVVAGNTLWVQCFRGLDSKPYHQWLRYRADSLLDIAHRAPDLVTSELSDPTFRDDGSILDWDRRRSQVRLLSPDPTAEDYVSEGVVDLPVERAGNRLVPAGEVILEQRGSSEEYRVLDLDRIIAHHRARRGAQPAGSGT